MNKSKSLIKRISVFLALCISLSSAAITAMADDTSSSGTTTQQEMGTPPSGEMPQGTPPADMGGGTPPSQTKLETKTVSSYFSDLTESYSWAIAQIDYLYENNIIKGTADGIFSPDATIKRGDFILMLSRKFNFAETTEANFSDVPADSYYYSAIASAKAAGVAKASSGDLFEPERAITRQEAVEMIYLAMVANGMPTDMSSTDLSAFSDADQISSDAATAVATLNKMKIVQGSNGMFSPNDNMTRAQMAVVFYNVSSMGGGQGGPGGTPPEGGEGGTPPSGAPFGKPDGQNSNSASVEASGEYTLSGETANLSNQIISATDANESAVLVNNGANLTLTDSQISSSSEVTTMNDSEFYGIDAAVLVQKGSTLTLKNSTVTTSGKGANAIFATGEGATINVSDVTINTTTDSARGLDATYGGTIIGDNLNITTQGEHCAAIATDRGEGTITVSNSVCNTAGAGSPGIYSTGNITVNNSTLTATGSEAAVIEGKNSITLNDSVLYGMKKHGIMMYQSFSGDAGVGTSFFNMTGGSLTAETGPVFYITNTDAVINISGAEIVGKDGILISASKDSWGTEGSNGGRLTFTADNETLDGDVLCDSISTIDMTLKNNTVLTGAINEANTAKSVSITLDSSSKWNVTGDSYLSAIVSEDTSLSNIIDNGHTIYYDSTNSSNSWLSGKTVSLSGGGVLKPIQ
ncbi:MAG: S-layer homology domain-containing protein [Clostridia bacterium]|nr:S-layer homology domain-containing protein [Clostridia bacterium]